MPQKMLRNFFFAKLQGYPRDMIFHQDGDPPHFAFISRLYLDRKLKSRRIDRSGLATWLPRSSDLVRCDFFLQHYIQDRIF